MNPRKAFFSSKKILISGIIIIIALIWLWDSFQYFPYCIRHPRTYLSVNSLFNDGPTMEGLYVSEKIYTAHVAQGFYYEVMCFYSNGSVIRRFIDQTKPNSNWWYVDFWRNEFGKIVNMDVGEYEIVEDVIQIRFSHERRDCIRTEAGETCSPKIFYSTYWKGYRNDDGFRLVEASSVFVAYSLSEGNLHQFNKIELR